MFAKSLCILLAVGLVAAYPGKSFKGVDPNTLKCDPRGQIELLLPHFVHCNRYYQCVHGREQDMPCGPGTIFDFEKQVCNHPWATKCWLRGQDDEVEGSGDDSAPEWEAAEAVELPRPVIAKVVKAVPEPTLNCNQASSSSKRLAYNGECQRFWRCQDGNLVSAFCADGLFFNAQTQMCDYEANVKCGGENDDELDGEFIVYK